MWLSSSSTKRSSNSTPATRLASTARPTSPGSTLAEVLRKNPFRAGSKDHLVLEEQEDEDTSIALNKDLHVLSQFFPDVKIEVFRELLVRFDGDSRLPICTEQIYKYKAEWARGRCNVPPRDTDELVPVEELFRTKQYVDAVRRTVGREFSSLSRSAIDAVLAEVNFSYTHARSTLQGLANKSWKATFTSIFRRKKLQDELPAILLEKPRNDANGRRLLATGSTELDQELERLFLLPISPQTLKTQQAIDLELAEAINLQEAEDADALYECQVCYNDATFEDIAVCNTSGHVICLNCVRRTLQEAIFGQGWAKSVDVHRGTVKCIAPTDSNDCDGCLSSALVRRAVEKEKSGTETWSQFEDRLFEFSLQTSNIPLVRCPFCSYAEVDQVYDKHAASKLKWHFCRPKDIGIFTLILILELLPALLFFMIPLLVLFPTFFYMYFYTALGHLALQQRTTRFICRRPSCSRKSCLRCLKAWHDPHVCHEPLILSLRTTIEAARTTAVKRTCPRCGTSFVKSSGCNKLTCVCGYSMCYLCRKNIGKAGPNNEGGEGYRHFCEHFRPTPGQLCTECDKCDLYRAEDEDAEVRRAGEQAERLWREREGMVGVKGLENATGNVAGDDNVWQRFWDGRWSIQGIVNWGVERCIVVTID
jgi:hypothetical protein